MKFFEHNVVFITVDDEAIAKQMTEKQELEEDAKLLNQISEMSGKLKYPHQVCR